MPPRCNIVERMPDGVITEGSDGGKDDLIIIIIINDNILASSRRASPLKLVFKQADKDEEVGRVFTVWSPKKERSSRLALWRPSTASLAWNIPCDRSRQTRFSSEASRRRPEEQKEMKRKKAKSTVDETAGAGTTGGLPALREFHRARRRRPAALKA